MFKKILRVATVVRTDVLVLLVQVLNLELSKPEQIRPDFEMLLHPREHRSSCNHITRIEKQPLCCHLCFLPSRFSHHVSPHVCISILCAHACWLCPVRHAVPNVPSRWSVLPSYLSPLSPLLFSRPVFEHLLYTNDVRMLAV